LRPVAKIRNRKTNISKATAGWPAIRFIGIYVSVSRSNWLAISTLLEAIISPLNWQKIVRKTRLQTWQLLAKRKNNKVKKDGRTVYVCAWEQSIEVERLAPFDLQSWSMVTSS
jgi:hypothetical protein